MKKGLRGEREREREREGERERGKERGGEKESISVSPLNTNVYNTSLK